MDFDHNGLVRPCNHTGISYGKVNEGMSVLDIWRCERLRIIRQQMRDYVIDENLCKHCVLQIKARHFDHVFSRIDFDHYCTEEESPEFPKRLSLELGNTCNLACVTCNPTFSSRIRKERYGLPPEKSPYGEQFFKDMEIIVPHLEHIAIFGGEPFLMPECMRLFEIIRKTKANCSLSISTNCMSLNKRSKRFLEELNISNISMSMDAVDAEVHEKIRCGLKTDIFFRNVEWLIDYAKRHGIWIQIATTEHRKNWYQLPEVFRFAEQRDLHLHINHCIIPLNVTLYTLPTEQLKLVYSFLRDQYEKLRIEYTSFRNEASYKYLLALIKDCIDARFSDWVPPVLENNSNINPQCDGILAPPIPGMAPIETPEKTIRLATEIAKVKDSTSDFLLKTIFDEIKSRFGASDWLQAATEIGTLREDSQNSTKINKINYPIILPENTRLFFIVGNMRSGTTWLQRLMNEHPEICCRGEMHALEVPEFIEWPTLECVAGQSASLREWYWMSNNWWSNPNKILNATKTRQELNTQLRRDYVRFFFEWTIQNFMEQQTDFYPRFIGDRSPVHTPFIGESINRYFGVYKPFVVHIVRDPRDVMVSWWIHNRQVQLDREFEFASPFLDSEDREECVKLLQDPQYRPKLGLIPPRYKWFGERVARQWKGVNGSLLKNNTILFPNSYQMIRYEDLLKNPEKSLSTVFSMMGAKADFDAVKAITEANRKEVNEGRAPNLRKGISGDWRNYLTSIDLDFLSSCKKLMGKMGYR
jgi:MoaA/NifB/PqqE/SkfB family radical SAM enzyme